MLAGSPLFTLALKCPLKSVSFVSLLQVFLWGKKPEGARSLILHLRIPGIPLPRVASLVSLQKPPGWLMSGAAQLPR